MRGIAAGLLLAAALSLVVPATAQVFDSQELDKAAPSTPAHTLFDQARAQQKAGNLDAAIDLYTQVIQLVPERPQPYFNRGHVYEIKKDYDQALADFNKMIAINAASAVYFNARAALYRVMKQCDLAAADYRQALSLPNPLEAGISHAGLGLCLIDRKDYAGAIGEFSQAIQLTNEGDRNLVGYYSNRGYLKELVHDYPGAVGDITQAMNRLPRNTIYVQELSRRGQVHRLNRDYDAAIADLSDAIAMAPAAGRFYERGLAYFAQGDDEHALADLNQGITFESNLPAAAQADFYLARAQVYQHRKALDQALADYSQGLTFAPERPGLLNGRCWVRALAKRELDGAIADCDAALKLLPGIPNATNTDYAQVLYHRGMAENAKGDRKAGAADIAAALAKDPHVASDRHDFGLEP